MTVIKKFIAVSAFVWACIISAVALMLPPEGEISASVLVLIAQLRVLVSSVVGFDLPVIINRHGTKD